MARKTPVTYDDVLSWWSSLSHQEQNYELSDFALEFAYQSAKIERADITFQEASQVFEHASVTNYTGPVRNLISIANQRVAFFWMLGALAYCRPLDESLVLSLHRTLTYGTYSPTQLADGERPGKYKLSDYIVRETHEVGASPEDCPLLTRELCREVCAQLPNLTPKRALTCAAYFHNALVSIHPFSEGTGRVARDLANFILLAGGHPPVCVYASDQAAFYEALEAFDSTGDLAPFKAFLREETLRTWEDRVR